MPAAPRDVIVRHLRSLAGGGPLAGRSDADLLRHFAEAADPAALDVLVRRHGPMVWNVCVRQAADREAAQDVFQATFLILARKAGSIGRPEAIGCWLHGVAVRVARRDRAARPRVADPAETPAPGGEPGDELTTRELFRVLDEELGKVRAAYRCPLVLCYLEGKTRDQAAKELGLTLATLKRRLEAGRDELRDRLTRRGVALPAALLAAAAAEAAVPAEAWAGVVDTPSSPVAALVAAELTAGGLAGVKAACWAVGFGAALAAGVLAAGLGGPGVDGPPAARPVAAEPDLPPVPFDDPLPPGAVARFGTGRLRTGDGIRQVVPAPGGKVLATLGDRPGVVLWDTDSGREAGRLDTGADRPRAVGFGAGGRVAAVAAGPAVVVWDRESGRTLARFAEADRPPPESVAVSPDGRRVAIGYADGTVRVRTVADAALVRLAGHTKPVRRLAFDAAGKRLATGGADGTVRVWDVDEGAEVRRWGGQSGDGAAVAFRPDGAALAAAGPALTVWDLRTGAAAWSARPAGRIRRAGYSDVAYTADGRHLLVGTPHGGIAVWTAGGEAVRGPKLERTGRLGPVALAPDGSAAAAAANAALRLWDPLTGAEWPVSRRVFAAGHARPVVAVAVADDGRTAFTSDPLGARRWDLRTGRPVGREMRYEDVAGVLAGGRTYLAVGRAEGAAVVERAVPDGALVRRFGGHPGPVAAAVLSADGRWLATDDGAGVVRLWDVRAGKEARRWDAPPASTTASPARTLALSADGERVAVAHPGGLVRLYATADGADAGRVETGGPVHAVVFTPDGKAVATAGGPGGAIRFWDRGTGREVGRVADPSAVRRPPRFALSPDGRRVATAGDGPAVRMWEVGADRPAHTFAGHAGPVLALAFDPSGRRLVTGGADGVGLVWQVNDPVAAAGRP